MVLIAIKDVNGFLASMALLVSQLFQTMKLLYSLTVDTFYRRQSNWTRTGP